MTEDQIMQLVSQHHEGTEIMNKIISLKPKSIFDVVNDSIFIEKNDINHVSYIRSGNYYEVYYAVAKYYQPDSILEIGVRYGYSLYSMISACNNLKYVRGYDIDQYEKDSIQEANQNISSVISKDIDFKIENNDSQKIKELDRFYDLIHIDGDHSYDGKIHDLNLTKGKCKFLIIDDYNHLGFVRSAVNTFVSQNENIIKNKFVIESVRGTYIIEYV